MRRAAADPYDPDAFDPADPDPWLALHLDASLPVDPIAKRALLDGNRSASRRLLYPVLKPPILVFFAFVKVLRAILPGWPNLNGPLHKLIAWGLATFAAPHANLLILRHFHIGTELIAFMAANAGPVEIAGRPLRPRRIADLADNHFLQHDLNIYNFVIGLNRSLRRQGRELTPPAVLDFSMISDEPFAFEPLPQGWLNVVDVQLAVEAYTPVYALFLPHRDFERAAGSLQLDETVAVYIARILGTAWHLGFIKNGHPLVPLSTWQAGYRLMMHGLDCEALHGWLRHLKRRQAAGLPLFS